MQIADKLLDLFAWATRCCKLSYFGSRNIEFMTRIKHIFVPVFLILSNAALFSSNLQSQDLRDPRFMERAQIGFAHIYNMDYAQAEQDFISLEKDYPRHPAPSLYLASILWLKELEHRQDLALSRFASPGYFSQKTDQKMPPREREIFFKHIQRCESLSNAILSKNRKDKDGRYFLAMTYGMRASFAITVDHGFREAFSSGNKAYSICSQIIKGDPAYYDAYLTLGTYEYIVGSIPWYLKWMVFIIGAHGSKQEGFEHLRLASTKGIYNKNEAQLVDMVLSVREHNYPGALTLAQSLADRFPRNFLFALNIGQILQYAGQKDQAASMLMQVLNRVEAREPNFDRLPLQKFRYTLALELMDMGKLDLAQEQFQKSADDPQTQAGEKALSHLHLARILEMKGRKNDALREYQTVLSLEDIEGTHDEAKSSLKKIKSQEPGARSQN